MPQQAIQAAWGATSIIKSNIATNNAAVIHTVTANSVFYLVSATLSLLVTAASQPKNSVFLEVDNSGNGVFRTLKDLDGMTTVAVDTLAVATSLTPSIPMPLSSGSVIRVRSLSANFVATGGIMGWEEPPASGSTGVGLVVLTFNEPLRVRDKVTHVP